jgi:glyoxylase-like metal-dependent hydrolase (beta-lactamase superfamily II)
MTAAAPEHGDPPAERPLRQEQEDASDEVTEVAPGILRLQLPIHFTGLGHVNCYALEDHDGVTLVDPGLPGEASWNALMARLDDASIPLRHVKGVIVTHSHPDHFGGAGMVAEHSGAEVIASTHFRTWWDPQEEAGEPQLDLAEAPGDEGRAGRDGRADDDRADDDLGPASPFDRPTPWGGRTEPMPAEARQALRERRQEAMRWFRVPRPTVRLDDADPLHAAEREWVAVFTPGHTHDHLCLFSPADGILLSGDHVLPSITPHISGLLHGDPLASYLDSLDKVCALDDVALALPAHGHPFRDLDGRVAAIKEHHDERLERLRVASAALGWADVADLSRELFSPRAWGSMAESETYAHLEHLRCTGRADRREVEGRLEFLAR